MNTIDAIMSRTSVRRFTDKKIPESEIRKILEAGMSGPSCVNARDWSFLVVSDKIKLNQMADANGKPAEPLRGAAFAVLICGDLNRAFPMAKDYWVIDGSIAAQNMILAAKDLGIGSVWLGTWPQMDRVEAQRMLFNLPESQIPHSIIAFGRSAEKEKVKETKWEESRVHYEQW
ncbi:MAG: nitroreductase family protein [Lachnospiraceae bacterium]|nr:nitroreductase family protein [Lachnospiraceae bacterium]